MTMALFQCSTIAVKDLFKEHFFIFQVILITAIFGISNAARLENTYLPPSGAGAAGGGPGLATPFGARPGGGGNGKFRVIPNKKKLLSYYI